MTESLLTLRRVCTSEKGTFGVIVRDDIPICLTCEDPWNDNRREISCIPSGTYIFKKFNGTKYKDVWEIENIPGRDAILIHAGNTIDDTRGCILVGRSFSYLGSLPSVMQSREALQILRDALPDEGVIEIINQA